jgi:cell division protease FtsH
MTAFHEAGHALIAFLEPASDPIHKATIIPRGRALGMVVRLPERDSYSYHRDKMFANLSVGMGGRVAEELVFGHDKVSSGASGDIQQATKLARSMVTQWGMSDKLGPLQYEEQQGETFLGYSQTQRHHISNETALLIDAEIRALVEGGYKKATTLLKKNIKKLHILAEALLEYETLTGDEIKALMTEGTRPDRSDTGGGKVQPVRSAGSAIPKTRKRGVGGTAAQGA